MYGPNGLVMAEDSQHDWKKHGCPQVLFASVEGSHSKVLATHIVEVNIYTHNFVQFAMVLPPRLVRETFPIDNGYVYIVGWFGGTIIDGY